MNFSFLPSKIKEKIKLLVTDKSPISLARSNAAIDGKPGESYVVAYNDKILFFSRKLGDHDYLQIAGEFGKDVADIKVRKEGNNSFLDAEINGQKYSLKFSSFEEKNLIPILKNFTRDSIVSDTETVTKSSDKTSTISPEKNKTDEKAAPLLEKLASSLMYISASDADIAWEEDKYIREVCNNNKDILKSALQYFKTHTFDELLLSLNILNHEQKLCFLANMMELGMCDGVLHRSEMDLIRSFCSHMELSEDEYDTIKQVLLIKNKLSVLSC